MPLRHAIFRQPTPEDLELHLRRLELTRLRALLTVREQALAHLRDQLHSFEARYIRQVGVLYRQLDEWETRITHLHVAAESIHDTERLLNEANIREALAPPTPDPEPPQPNLKSLFRELAKRIHPDFATTPLDALHRTRLMAQANDALLRHDAALLLRMLNGHDPSTIEPAAAALARTLAQIAQSHADILAVDAALEALANSEMALLRDRTLLAAADHRDLLAELAARVKGSIGLAMRRYELDLARLRRNQPASNPNPLLSAEITPPKPNPDTMVR